MRDRKQLRKQRLANATKEDPKLFDALSEFGGLLPKSAGVFVALTAVAYFSGWREGSTYYRELGAPWIVASVPRFAFLELSAGMMVVIALFAFTSLHQIARHTTRTKPVTWAAAVAMCVSVLSLLASGLLESGRLPKDWASPSNIWLLGQAHAIFMYISSGLLLGVAIANFRDAKLKWSPNIVFILYTALFYGLYTTPGNLGNARAHYHLAAPSETLPSVDIIDGGPSEKWRLVELLGQTALLMKVPDGDGRISFRIVQLKDIKSISKSPKLSATMSIPTVAKSDKSSAPQHSPDPIGRPQS